MRDVQCSILDFRWNERKNDSYRLYYPCIIRRKTNLMGVVAIQLFTLHLIPPDDDLYLVSCEGIMHTRWLTLY